MRGYKSTKGSIFSFIAEKILPTITRLGMKRRGNDFFHSFQSVTVGLFLCGVKFSSSENVLIIKSLRVGLAGGVKVTAATNLYDVKLLQVHSILI